MTSPLYTLPVEIGAALSRLERAAGQRAERTVDVCVDRWVEVIDMLYEEADGCTKSAACLLVGLTWLVTESSHRNGARLTAAIIRRAQA